jgi:hypothetical protein
MEAVLLLLLGASSLCITVRTTVAEHGAPRL